MYLLCLVVFVTFISRSHNQECNGVVFLDEYYDKVKIVDDLNQPSNLALHQYTDDLFFQHVVWNSISSDFFTRACNIKNKKCFDPPEGLEINAIAYDRITRHIYLGGNGIYKFNYSKRRVQRISEIKGISHIFVHKQLYVIRASNLFVYNSFENSLKIVPEFKNIKMYKFFVSNALSTYYTNASGLYKIAKPGSPTHLLSNKIKVQQITQNYRKGNVFFAATDGIYVDDLSQRTVTKLPGFKRAFGLTFKYTNVTGYGSSQLIYSDYHSIFMLAATKNNTMCLEKLNGESRTELNPSI